MNGSMDAGIYNNYTIAPPYLGVVNNTDTPYAQQPPTTAVGGLTYTYVNQIMYPQPQNLYTQTQTVNPQVNTHIPQPQNFNMQGPDNQLDLRQMASL